MSAHLVFTFPLDHWNIWPDGGAREEAHRAKKLQACWINCTYTEEKTALVQNKIIFYMNI